MMPRYTESAASCAAKLKVLAGETRLAVLQQLMKRPRHVGEMNATLGTEPTLLSHHLKILRDAGLVPSRRDGKATLHSLAPAVADNRLRRSINLGCCLLSFE